MGSNYLNPHSMLKVEHFAHQKFYNHNTNHKVYDCLIWCNDVYFIYEVSTVNRFAIHYMTLFDWLASERLLTIKYITHNLPIFRII